MLSQKKKHRQNALSKNVRALNTLSKAKYEYLQNQK